jgi:hypothetical protein
MPKTIIYPPIGIAGAALSGKDTLCSYLIYNFALLYNTKAKRCSIAGDIIRKDLQEMIFSKIDADIDINDPLQKESVRPLMVEYGRYMRNQTKGRYFIEILNKSKQFGKNFIPIIPDIRYNEYEKDELYWLKEEKKGILVFLERDDIPPANKFEKNNNISLKKAADVVIEIQNFYKADDYADFIQDYVDKIITIYQSGISQPLDRS